MQPIYNFIAKKMRPIEVALFLKKILLVKRRNHRIGPYLWNIDPVSDFGFRMINEGIYEKEMTNNILSNLNKGDVFVDLGANEGYFSVVASLKVGNSGKVFCIEPQMRLWPVILNNIQLNRLSNVTVFPYAISNVPETIDLILSPSINTGSSTFTKDFRRKFWKRQRINATTLDDLFFDQNSKIKVLKIDIEGFEFFALKSAVRLLQQRRIENIIIEFHEEQLHSLGHSPKNINAMLNEYGFSEANGVYKLSNQ